jgi:peptidyl-prolyl cis-trans isomerase SurA
MRRLPTPSNLAATLAALALAFVFSQRQASAAQTARQPFDGIVAVVDDQIILLSELEDLRAAAAEQQPGMSRLPADVQRKELLSRLIDDKVLLVKAKQDTSIKVSERDILPRVDDAISRYVEQQGGEKKFETLLKQTNGMSLAQFRTRLTQQYMEQAYRQKLQYKYVGDHDPSNSQIRDFFKLYQDSLPMQQNGIKLSHIQVKVMPGADLEKAAWMKADSLIKRLDKGESFTDLAKKYSDDFSGKDGGDIGYTKRGTLDPDYERVAFSLDAGDYAKFPVRSRHGYHIIKVTGKKDTEIRTSHILIKLVPSAADTARTKALMDSLRTVAIKDTGAFAALARKYSEDKKTREEGGNLGWFTREQIDPQYLSAVDSLPEGGVSRPVAIGDGYHLFRLDKKAAARKLNLDEDFGEISQMARNYYLGQKLSGYVKKWRETVHVEDRLAQYKNLPGDAEAESQGDGSGPAGIPLR